MRFQPDPRFTFDTFVAGPGSQMAAAAARRAAEAPGTSYNPLFLYGDTGVGKSHLLHAVGNLALTVRPDLHVVCRTADELVDDISSAVSAGTLQAFTDELLESDIILLDDVQLLAGRSRTQEELLRVWDEIVWTGTQIVLAAALPPAEIDVGEEFRGKLAGGLVVDMTPAEAETRLQIVRREAARLGVEMGAGVDEALARLPLSGARELQAGVGRIAEAQAHDGRQLRASELPGVVGIRDPAAPADEFSAFVLDIASTVGQLVEGEPWRRRLAEAILRHEGEGFRTRRLETALEADSAPELDALLAGYAADLEKLQAIAAELEALGAEAAGSAVLRDPDRLGEAEALLAGARAAAERSRPAPPPVDKWYANNPEKVAWRWLALDDRLIEELA